MRLYNWNGTAWTQKGIDIDGEAAGDFSGNSVSMSDANTVAIGGSGNNGNGSRAGQVRIYNWDGTTWTQNGSDIDGEDIDDFSGSSVSMPDANTVAIGAFGNDGNGSDAGHVRIYSIGAPQNIEYISFKSDEVHAYPTPTSGKLNLEFTKNIDQVKVSIKNLMGKEVFSENYKNQSQIELHFEGASGIYFVEVISKDKQMVMKVVKE